MHMPEGDAKGWTIDPKDMLEEDCPVIGTGEWTDPNHQCENFKSTIKIGDIVMVRKGNLPIALCEVTSESYKDDELEEKYGNSNFRNVIVLDYWKEGKVNFKSQGTLSPLYKSSNSNSWNIINNWYKQILNKMETTQIVDILKQKKQIILQGAPGTGKTYITASVALSLIGEIFNPNDHKEIMAKYDKLVNDKRIFFTTFHQSMDYEDFVEGLKPVVDGNMTYEVKDGIFKLVCKSAEQKGSLDELEKAIKRLKQDCSDESITAETSRGVEFSVSYRDGRTFRVRSENSNAKEGRDFPANIESIKDYYKGKTDGIYNISYVRGICDYLKKQYGLEAYKPQNNELNYVLIIDEINRGNISKIFGELITLLEVDKRAGGEHPIKARLAYSNEENFSVPSNLYIIGTMNTTDRSVGHIDYAIRRRFAFYTLTANKDAITSYYDTTKDIESGTKEIALDLFKKTYDFVDTHKSLEFDIEDLMIGHSYFMAKGKKSLKMKLQYEIIPLIKEYEKDGIMTLKPDERKSLGQEWINLFETTK